MPERVPSAFEFHSRVSISSESQRSKSIGFSIARMRSLSGWRRTNLRAGAITCDLLKELVSRFRLSVAKSSRGGEEGSRCLELSPR